MTGPVEPELQQLHIRISDSAINQIDSRFKVLQQSPITDFAVLDYRQWPHETSELAVYGKEQIENLVRHFAPVLTEEEVEGVVKEFTSFKVHVTKLRTSSPKMVFRDMLLMPPESCKKFMALIEIMMTISMSTAVV